MGTTMISLAWGGDPGRWGDGAGGWWPIFPIVWVALLALAVTFAILYARRTRTPGPAAAEARLADRYASGEIDESEYRARLDVLRKRR